MELKDERRIHASREAVFAALNDPDVLRQCIPGCESLEKLSDTELKATVSLKVGPVKARFQGGVQLSNINPPIGYTIMGEGSAGPAGNARGGADVTLVEDGDGTVLKYTAKAEVVGKLAQLGGRLIDSTAKMLAGQFFDKFAAVVGGEAVAAVPEATPDATMEPEVTQTRGRTAHAPVSRISPQAWIGIGALVVVVALLAFALLGN